jgi:DNA-binding transcriptional regulator YhcF (GntR family)
MGLGARESGEIMLSRRFSTRAIYQQLRDILAARIATGEWKPGTVLPSEADLAREFGESAGTTRKALKLLEAERLLTRRQGRGTIVNDPATGERALRYSNLCTSVGERSWCGQSAEGVGGTCERSSTRPAAAALRGPHMPSQAAPSVR